MASWRTDHVLERLIGTSDTPKERNLPPLASPNLSPCAPPPRTYRRSYILYQSGLGWRQSFFTGKLVLNVYFEHFF